MEFLAVHNFNNSRKLTIQKIRRESVSVRRNELIADMFHKISFVEKWGRGIKLILSHEPDTRFKEVGQLFIAVFRRKYKESEKGTEKGTEKITKNQKNILKKMSEDNKITILELSKIVGISNSKIKENIAKLKKKKLLKRIGPDKGGYWEVA